MLKKLFAQQSYNRASLFLLILCSVTTLFSCFNLEHCESERIKCIRSFNAEEDISLTL